MNFFDGLIVPNSFDASVNNIAAAYPRLERQFIDQSVIEFNSSFQRLLESYYGNHYGNYAAQYSLAYKGMLSFIFRKTLEMLAKLGSHLPLAARSQYLLSLPEKIYQIFLLKRLHLREGKGQNYDADLMYTELLDSSIRVKFTQFDLLSDSPNHLRNNMRIDQPYAARIDQMVSGLSHDILTYVETNHAQLAINVQEQMYYEIMLWVTSMSFNIVLDSMPSEYAFGMTPDLSIADITQVRRSHLINYKYLLEQIDALARSIRINFPDYYDSYRGAVTDRSPRDSFESLDLERQLGACTRSLESLLEPQPLLLFAPTLVTEGNFVYETPRHSRAGTPVPGF